MMRFLLFVLVTVSLAGCGRKGGQPVAIHENLQGQWSSETEYVNGYFGIRLSVPDGWHVQKGTIAETNQRAVDFLAGDEKNLRSVMKSAVEQTHTVFVSHRYPPGTPGKRNPSVVLLIENVTHLPGIASSDDYLRLMEETLKLSNKTFTFLPHAEFAKFGELEFATRKSDLPVGTMTVHQQFYAIFKSGFVLLLGVNTMEKADDDEVAMITNSIKAL